MNFNPLSQPVIKSIPQGCIPLLQAGKHNELIKLHLHIWIYIDDDHLSLKPSVTSITHYCYTRALSLTDYHPCMHAPRTHTHAHTHTHTHTQLTLMDCTQLIDTLAQVLTSRKSLTTSLWMFTLIVPSHFSTNLTYTVTFQDDGCITRTEGAIDWRVAG